MHTSRCGQLFTGEPSYGIEHFCSNNAQDTSYSRHFEERFLKGGKKHNPLSYRKISLCMHSWGREGVQITLSQSQIQGHFICNPNPPSQMLIGLVQGITKASGGSQATGNTATQNEMFSKWICFFANSNDSPPGISSSVWRLLKLQMAMSNDNVQATPYPTLPPEKSSKELSLVKHPECKVIQ